MDKAWRNMMNPFAEGALNIYTGKYIKSGNRCRKGGMPVFAGQGLSLAGSPEWRLTR
jgi:hypothetical protein